MPSESFPVVIVGAGPTGTTTATLLAQYGINSLLLDRWQAVYPQPRAVHLDNEIYRVLGQVGVADDFSGFHGQPKACGCSIRACAPLAEFARDTASGIHGLPQANMFDQPELEALLRANLATYPNATLRGGADVTAVVPVGGDRVQVRYTDRATNEQHTVEASYVLGCDGANSVVRSAIGARMRSMRFAQRWLVVDVATDADLHLWDGVQHVCDPRRAATFMRIARNRYRWEFQLHPAETVAHYHSLEQLRPLLSAWLGDIPATQLELIRVAEYTFRAQIADRWRRGRMLILGDAAHLTPPFIGQGMGAGIRDAANLSWKLAAVLHGDLPAHALDTYQQERKGHAWKMIGLALVVGWTMTGGGKAGNILRRWLIPRLERISLLRRHIQEGKTPPLRHSTFVVKSTFKTLPNLLRMRRLPGTLMPNLALPSGDRIDTVLGNKFGLITDLPLSLGQQSRLKTRDVVGVVVSAGSEFARWLHRGGTRAALIRPDRTVMQIGHPAQLCSLAPCLD
ncbi:bifunctional 3-(3-hydroxy-phenyl)propionate/3-hydroxycinnamic acid hydroxylase [Mycobacteroides abscessus subsp. massiliense]|uniref:bifunctional 3-(3-hydroxy-phenyl)propionate/3-hydroxycinnamic acid hydroxylase n=1 Tax=Mycobacteroides abscessus TaxID=36809 RepID=UPI00266D396C|nr:bifunctional 3-(3-hydroxy-phenyl)propionate/3-hydroxycinnamic acid hydroxylase [Mycobacteroides abscessus]MDO3297755.1 bifunctional 3-(3-hydroxy-phenyl)propionate/3-hydroxycinnamic acid hydroxylase [Mycobacteroides abscessus subsp. massiliense]